MTMHALLTRIHLAGIRLRKNGGELAVSGDRTRLDASLIGELRAHKAALLEMVESAGGDWWAPPLIRPEMLPLVELTQAEVDRIVDGVPGGGRNVQDVYPLAPLQEGILFHHLLADDGDPYLTPHLLGFDARERLDAFVGALQAVVDRHDILRTAVVWEGLPEPVQVVWRRAPLPVQEVELDPAAGDVAEQLHARLDPRHHRIDVRRAPMLHLHVARDAAHCRWVMLLLRHHLISDNTTLDVLLTEIQAHLLGRAGELPPPLPFRNLVAQARLGISREEHEAFFRELLGDVDEPTAPFGLLDVRGDGSGIAEARREVDGALAARLRERARRMGVSAASVCHVAWAQVLARVSGREDVVFGTVLFGRMQGGEGADRVMGPFINTLPLRIRVAEEGAEASVRRMQALLAGLVRHEHASLALAQRCSGVPAPAPLFSSLLNYRHGGGGASAGSAEAQAAAGGIQAIYAEERSNYPLTVAVDDVGGGFVLTAKVQASVGPERVCALLHAALEGLVDALERAPETPVGRLDVLPGAERRRVVEEWNATDASYPAGLCVHELFEAQVERTPDATAVVCEEESLTYAELDARANRLAHYLRERGVGPDSRVGICAERSPEMMVGLLAILKAGGAYVPLDPGYPRERLRYMLEDSGPAVLLAQASLAGLFEGIDVPVVDLRAGWAGHPQTRPERAGLTPDHVAYVIYTSGSTGRPKGVMVPHRGVVNRLAWGQEAWQLSPRDAVLLKTSLSFDGSLRETFWPLATGARVVMAHPGGHRDPDYLLETIRREGVGTVNLVPSMLHALLEHPRLVESCAGLRQVLCGGEALPTALLRRFRERLPHVALHNLYGPSEAATALTALDCTPREATATVPIGRPVANTRVYVLDAVGEPLPVRAAGELYVGGVGVARCYWRRPALTAERFVPDPFGGRPGSRLYRTGDAARLLEDGAVEFLGRRDGQVKVRGFRVELGEIESVLADHPGVRRAVVGVRESASGERTLLCGLVPEAGEALDPVGVRGFLSRTLPDHMVPSHFTLLESLPLLPSGKVDRRAALALLEDAQPVARAPHVPPSTATERLIADVWSRVLKVEPIGIHDNFFELGGHSLLALQVVFRVREALEIDLALRSLFETPTVAGLAQHVERAASRAGAPPLERADRSRPLPLSFAQQRLWFLYRLNPGDPSYNVSYALRLRGQLRVEVLRRALDEIVRRHEVLRTTYPTVGGEPRQEIHQEMAMPLRLEDLRGEEDPESVARQGVAEEMGRPFDLAEGPLLRAGLFRVHPEEHFVVVVLHHIVSDAWSIDILVRELVALYTAFSRQEPSPLEELPFQYADFAAWQRRLLTPEVVSAQLDHWKRHLGERPPVLQLPTDRPRRVRGSVRGGSHSHPLPRRLRDAVLRVSREHAVTPFVTTFAAFQVLLHRYSGQEGFVVGSPVAEREDPGLDGVIGFFLNMLPIRADLGGNPTLAELLERVRGTTLDAIAHQQLPFERLVEAFQLERDLVHTPLFQVMFTYQDASSRAFELPGLEIAALDVPARNARFDLTLFLTDTGEEMAARMEYDADLFDGSTIERMMRHLQSVLEAVAGDPGQPVGEVPLLAPDESELLLRGWNRTQRDFPLDHSLHALIGRWAEQDPDAPAAEFESDRLSRGELDRRANQLARLLRARGVGPDVPVGICVERSPEMLVGILGILKAGGAYLPLDPAYPVERLSYMVQDSAARLVLTRERLLERLPALDAEVLCLDTGWETRVAGLSGDPVESLVSPENLAYIVYTSGSTGRPKGTMVSHRSVVNHGLAVGEVYGLDRNSRFSQLFSLSFDGSVEDFFPVLLAGGVLLCHSDPTQQTLREVLGFYRDRGVSVLHLPTALWHHFATELHEGRVEMPPSVRLTSAGGEGLAMEKLRAYFQDTGGRVPFLNVYGPTEATVTASTLRAEAGDWDGFPGRTLPIGRPLANVSLYVLDGRLRPTPVGVPGELYIGGAGVARGYLGRPGLTGERFVPDPFAGDGSRLYRTGDRARYLPDGTLEYLERIDKQVKVRSFRIELGEIEAALVQHPAITDAVVQVKTHGVDDERIVAYVVPSGQMPPAAEVRRHLERFLPAFMIPAALVPLERLPLTPNGKIDHARLPAPEYREQSARSFVAPRTPDEERIARIWREVLQLEQVGVEDNFFELGGHSLLAVRVHDRLQAEFGREIPLIHLFEHSTVAGLARSLSPGAAEAPEEEDALQQSEEWGRERREALRRQRASRRSRASRPAE